MISSRVPRFAGALPAFLAITGLVIPAVPASLALFGHKVEREHQAMAQALVSVGYTLLTAICISSFAFIFDAQASGFRAAVPFLLGAALTCSGAAVAAYVLLAGANALVPTSDHESVRENEGEPSPHHLAKLRRQRTSNAVDTHGNVVPVAERSPIKRTGKRTTCKRVSAETVISAHNASMARLPAVANDVPMEVRKHSR